MLRDPDRKPVAQLFWEMARYGMIKKDPGSYVYSLLYRKGIRDPYPYLSGRQYRKLRSLVKNTELVPFFNNKLRFQKHFVQSGIPLPVYLGHLSDGTFFGATGIEQPVTRFEDFARLSADLLSPDRTSYFAKPLRLYGGKGAFKVTAESDLDSLFHEMDGNDYLFQETIEQHPILDAVYPHSLNTLRVTTCIPRDDTVCIACARMRFGQGGRCVDNGSSGGFHAGVDLETGRLKTRGIQAYRFGGNVYDHHPDSGVAIRDLQLPLFSEAMELVRAAANHLRYPLVGWDVAFTPGGPIITEGNDDLDYYDDEMASGAYMANPVLRPFIEELAGGKKL